MMEKSELRSRMKALGASFSDTGESLRLWSRLEQTPEFLRASTVLAYMSLADEVPTREFLDRWSTGKRMVLPLVRGRELLLKEYSPLLLQKGYAGILEPTEDAGDVAPCEVDLAIVPGQAFDPACRRLGRGKGFYDRLLPRLSCPVFGIAYDWRVVPQIPFEPWDISVSAVITPENEYRKD